MMGGSSSPVAGDIDGEGDVPCALLTAPLESCTTIAWATWGLTTEPGLVYTCTLRLGSPNGGRAHLPQSGSNWEMETDIREAAIGSK